MSEKKKSLLGVIIDAPIEEVDKLLKDSHYNITALLNFKKGLELEYQRAETTKNQLMAGIENNTVDKEKSEEIIQQLYIAMQRIEDRATVVQKYIEELEIKN
jgi:uncharacterized protein YaaQ